jgi:hypothetical protein
LGKNSLCGAFGGAHELVPLDRSGYAYLPLFVGAAAQHAAQAPDPNRAGLSQLVRQSHYDFDGGTALQTFGQVKVKASRADFSRFRGSLADHAFIGPTNRQGQPHKEAAR